MEAPKGGQRMPVPADAAQGRFAEQVNKMIRSIRILHYSIRTEEAYVGWARRFLTFAQARHPQELDGAKVRLFLDKLAVREKVSASTQNQALNALVFFFREGLGLESARQVQPTEGGSLFFPARRVPRQVE